MQRTIQTILLLILVGLVGFAIWQNNQQPGQYFPPPREGGDIVLTVDAVGTGVVPQPLVSPVPTDWATEQPSVPIIVPSNTPSPIAPTPIATVSSGTGVEDAFRDAAGRTQEEIINEVQDFLGIAPTPFPRPLTLENAEFCMAHGCDANPACEGHDFCEQP